MKIGIFEFAIDESVAPSIVAMRSEKLGFAPYGVPEHPIIPIQTSQPYPTHRGRPRSAGPGG